VRYPSVHSSKQIDSFDLMKRDVTTLPTIQYCEPQFRRVRVPMRMRSSVCGLEPSRYSQCRCCRPLLRTNDKSCAIHSTNLGYVVLNPFDRRPINPFELHWTFLRFYRDNIACCSSDLFRSRPQSWLLPFSVLSILSTAVDFFKATISYSIMSDIDSDADSISGSSNAHSDDDAADGDEASISVAIRELCIQLRTNDPLILCHSSTFILSRYITGPSEAEWIAVFQALKENTSVKHIDFILFERHCTKRAALIAAEYVESSKTLQTMDLGYDRHFQDSPVLVSVLLRALSRNTSVTKLIINTEVVRFANVTFQELLTCTQTLQKLQICGYGYAEFDEVHIAAIKSGFANNTTLRVLELSNWREADLAAVLPALHRHPALKKIHLSAAFLSVAALDYIPSLSGLEVLFRSQDSKVEELVLEQVDTRTVGLYPVIRELGRNTTVTNLAIRNSVLSRETLQQLKAVLRQNTTLQHLIL
jgi:hypothetical protein